MNGTGAPRQAIFDDTLRRAVELHQAGHGAHAQALYEGAAQLMPEHPDPPQLLGVLAAEAGDRARAELLFSTSLRLKPDQPFVLVNLGNVHAEEARAELALRCFDQALELSPGMPAALVARSVVLANQQRFNEAIASIDAALAVNPTDLPALLQRARLLVSMQRLEEAVTAYERTVAHYPDRSDGWIGLGGAAFELGERSRAITAFDRARGLEPANFSAALGCLQARLTPFADSTPQFVAAEAEFAHELDRFCDWAETVARPTDMQRTSGPELFYLAYRDGAVELPLSRAGRAIATVTARWHQQRALPPASSRRGAGGPGRAGIVTSHLREHSVYDVITRAMLAGLEAAGFETSLYSLSAEVDSETRYAAAKVAHFVSGPRAVADWMRVIATDQNDLLLYPEVGINDLTLKLAATRLAPVQAVGWGHPVTTGLPTMDYYLSAAAFEPDNAEAHYAESLIRLPNLGCMLQPGTLLTQNAPRTGVHLPSLGLDASAPLFICPGTPFKYLPVNDEVLVEIATRLGKCQFALFELEQRREMSTRVFERLAGAFDRRGLDWTQHLRLLPWQPKSAFRSLCSQATAVLDTIGFSGFNSAVHALQANAPLIGFRASRMRGRLASGSLEYLGLGDLVAGTTEEMVSLAVGLARDPSRAAIVRERISAAMPKTYGDRSVIEAVAEFAKLALGRARG